MTNLFPIEKNNKKINVFCLKCDKLILEKSNSSVIGTIVSCPKCQNKGTVCWNWKLKTGDIYGIL